jgi:hypothetical protein
MKLFFAGNAITYDNEVFLCSRGLNYRLLSYADFETWSASAFSYWTSDAAPAPLFLDSGAFGAFTRGQVIDLKKYCAFILQHPTRFYPYASLDVIGDWRASAHNWDLMRAEGVNAMPTFHMNSPETELRRLLKAADYLALGGVVGATQETMQPWLDKCWRVIRDYWPVKVHVFGVMAQWCLERYPWYSADSSSALVGAGMGRITEFDAGRVTSYPWMEYAHARYDGDVMDGYSRWQAKKGSAWKGRAILNIEGQLALQQHITDLWALRGITWEEPCAVSTALLDPASTATS